MQEKPCIKVVSSTWLDHPSNKNAKMSFAYAFCQYDDIFIDQNSELVSYSDAIKKCGTRGELAESRGLAWPHELRLRMGILSMAMALKS